MKKLDFNAYAGLGKIKTIMILLKSLKLNVILVSTFGAGIGALYPVVDGLMRNMNMHLDFEYLHYISN